MKKINDQNIKKYHLQLEIHNQIIINLCTLSQVTLDVKHVDLTNLKQKRTDKN